MEVLNYVCVTRFFCAIMLMMMFRNKSGDVPAHQAGAAS